MSGKGSKPRPLSIPYDEYLRKFDEIFKKELKEEPLEYELEEDEGDTEK